MKQGAITSISSILLLLFVMAAPAIQASDQPASFPKGDHHWQQYNRKAAQTNAPLLSYFSLCKDLKYKKKLDGPVDETDTFSTDDKQFYFFTRWKNMDGRHHLRVAIYSPRSGLFDVRKFTFNGKGPNWKVARFYFIRNAPPSRIPGKWRCDIFMDGILAASKTFSIGDPGTQYPASHITPETPAIGVVLFEYNQSDGKPMKKKYAWRLSELIGQSLVADFPAYRIVLPSQIHHEFEITSSISLRNGIDGVLHAPLFDNLIKSNNIKLLLVGSTDLEALNGLKPPKVQTYIDNYIYLIDAKQKKLIGKVYEPYYIYFKDFKERNNETIVEMSNAVYKKFIKKSRADIEQAMAKTP